MLGVLPLLGGCRASIGAVRRDLAAGWVRGAAYTTRGGGGKGEGVGRQFQGG